MFNTQEKQHDKCKYYSSKEINFNQILAIFMQISKIELWNKKSDQDTDWYTMVAYRTEIAACNMKQIKIRLQCCIGIGTQ